MEITIPDEVLRAIAMSQPISIDDIKPFANHPDALGQASNSTLLAAAAYANRTDLIRALVGMGANVNFIPPNRGLSALHHAGWDDSVDAIKALVELGANIEIEIYDGTTPLMFAAAAGECEAVKTLLALGADVNHRDKEGANAWEVAMSKGMIDAGALLQAAGAVTI